TVTEANRALPRLAELIVSVQRRFLWLKANQPAIAYTNAEYQVVQESPVSPAYLEALFSIRAALKEVEAIGAEVKDIGSGLVDFPARLFGRDVLLCWRLGEDRVRFYHDPEAGFAGRQPLPDDEGGQDRREEGH
ncbi:MAG TPA: DUF2203 domain-containing protein, partial [Candidatus Polarisedimenticolia bacterium]|nr:DUF2203 domain-containing protein [Candidatus Polarisedimenticolia bacterium]